MSVKLYIHLENQEQIQKLLQASGKKPKPIIKKAVNEAAQKAREKIYSGVKQGYTVKRSAFTQKDVSIKKATTSRLYAQLEVSGSPLSLTKAYKTAKEGKRTAAKAAVKRGALKKLEKGDLKGFVAKMKAPKKRGKRSKRNIREFSRESLKPVSPLRNCWGRLFQRSPRQSTGRWRANCRRD